MEPKKQIIFMIYVVVFFILGLTLLALGNEQIGKKVFGTYFIVGVAVSFIFKVPLFGRYSSPSEPENSLSGKYMLANLFALIIAGVLLFT